MTQTFGSSMNNMNGGADGFDPFSSPNPFGTPGAPPPPQEDAPF
jgi:hypothetical protein